MVAVKKPVPKWRGIGTQLPVGAADPLCTGDLVRHSMIPGWFWYECRWCGTAGESRETDAAALKHFLSIHNKPKDSAPTRAEKRPDVSPGLWMCADCHHHMAQHITSDDHANVCPARKASGVDHPAHYKAGDLEAITVIEALGHGHGFCVGNALKYLWRAGKKTPDALEDLRKARWYVDRAIAALEKGGR